MLARSPAGFGMGDDQERTKSRLRREAALARSELDATLAVRLATDVCRRAAAVSAVADARHLVAYSPIGREVDPDALVRDALAAGATVYYPRWREGSLDFLAADRERLVPGPHGTLEPSDGSALPPGASGVVILVPGVAFDARGARLGRGLGCYDRALAHHPTAFRIGLAYEIQIVPALPECSWDERMDVVATEARCIRGEPRPGRAVKEISAWN